MTRTLAALMLAAALASPAHADVIADVAGLGDSMMDRAGRPGYGLASWGELLAQRDCDLDFVNMGLGGATLAQVNRDQVSRVQRHRPRAVVLFVANEWGSATTVAGAVASATAWYGRVIEGITARGLTAIVLPHGRLASNVKRGGLSAGKYNRAAQIMDQRLATMTGVHFVPAYQKMLLADGLYLNARFTSDGLHLNARGYQRARDALVPTLRDLGLCAEPEVAGLFAAATVPSLYNSGPFAVTTSRKFDSQLHIVAAANAFPAPEPGALGLLALAIGAALVIRRTR